MNGPWTTKFISLVLNTMTIINVTNREDLLSLIRKGQRFQYLFFWGHKPSSTGEITPSCFSQWWLSPFSVGDVNYASAEHFMMAQKAQLFGDETARLKILETGSPKIAKQLGRKVKGFKEDVWQNSRFELVVEGNLAKFSQNDLLGQFLTGTGDRVLVEASPVDRVWGIGMSAADDRATNPEQWRGLNLLGFALMEVRQQLLTEKLGIAKRHPKLEHH
jgi:ribA/ribD-fused uncharacterized protein